MRLAPLAAIGLSLALAAGWTVGAAHAEPRTVSVTASGTAKARPDTAAITIGVATEGASAREALDANTAAMVQVIEALKAEGLEQKDIQTVNFSVHPRYHHDRDGAAPRIIGYRVVNSARITVRQLDRLGVILDEVVTRGSNEIGSIEFMIEDPAALRDEARRAAITNAKRMAGVYAEAVGARIGKVLTIAERAEQQPPRPVFLRATSEARSGEVPIEAGEHSVRVDVTVTWELD